LQGGLFLGFTIKHLCEKFNLLESGKIYKKASLSETTKNSENFVTFIEKKNALKTILR